MGTVAALALLSAPAGFGQDSTIDSLTGQVTAHEVSTFKSAISGLVPGNSNSGNNYAYGNGGDAMEACADMYDITKDRSILDKLILYCDKVVSIRNTNRVMWTGNIDPVWPNSTNNVWGCEQGDVAGHLAYCAQLIAENPLIWNTPVSFGDPNGYGATYQGRAATYLAVVDQTMDLFYVNNFIHSDGYMQTPPDPPWPDPNSAGDAVPWNQQNMICGALIRGADAHSRFGDGSSRIAKFRASAAVSITRYFAQCNNFRYTRNGKTVCKWSYSGGNFAPGAPIRYTEDTAHGGYDITAIHRAAHWLPGGPVASTNALMVADTLMEVIKTNTQFWSKVDGTGSLNSGMKNSWTYLSEWRSDAFAATTATGSQYYADAARKLWIKNALANGWPNSISLGLNLPDAWLDVDIGNPGVVGSATCTNGAFTLQGSGADIGPTSDQFNFMHKAVAGDFTLTARVAGQTGPDGLAKAGLMARAGTSADSAFVGAWVTPANGLLMQYRAASAGAVVTLTNAATVTAPRWLQLVRQGATFTACQSADGTNWSALGSVAVTVGSTLAGLAVTSHNNASLNTSSFDQLTLQAVGFDLEVDPSSVSVLPGSNAVCSVSVVPINGFSSSVALSVTGMPARVNAGFSPAVATPSQGSTLTLSASNNATPGTYTLTLTGTSGALSVNVPVYLTVKEPPPSADTRIVAADNAWVLRSQSTTVEDSSETLQVKRLADSNTRISYVRFSVSSFLASHAPSAISQAKLCLYIPSAVSGAGTLDIYGLLDNAGGTTGGDSAWSSTTMTWTKQPAKSAAPDDISALASALPNTNTTALLGSASIPSTAGEFDITLNLQGLVDFLGDDSNQQITLLFVNTSATIASFASLNNTSGFLQPTLELVCPVCDFSLGLAPATQGVLGGSNATVAVTIVGTNGFAGNVTLSVDDLPAGMSATFTPGSISGSGSAALTLSTTADVEPDIYVIPVTATSGIFEHRDTITLTVSPGDSDGDGIPDTWMLRYFGHATGQAADDTRAQDDYDGDGMSNLAEYLAGTDPTDPASNLRFLSIQPEGDDLRVTWSAVGGVSYIVQISTNLAAGFYDGSPVITPGSAGATTGTFLDSGAGASLAPRFYRVRLAP